MASSASRWLAASTGSPPAAATSAVRPASAAYTDIRTAEPVSWLGRANVVVRATAGSALSSASGRMRWRAPRDCRSASVAESTGPLTTHVCCDGAEPKTLPSTAEPAEIWRPNSSVRPTASHPRIGTDTYVAGRSCDWPARTSWVKSTRAPRSTADPALRLSSVCGVTARLTRTPG